MAQNHFQRLSVSLIHSKKEERQHDNGHSHGCQRHVSGLFQKKKERQSDKDRSSETEDLAFGEIEEELALHPGQIPRYIGVKIIQRLAPFRRTVLT